MNKLKGILLTQGMHGMISQVEGLAKSLDLEFIHEKIELNNIWGCLLYTSPSPRDRLLSRMPSSA